MPRFYGMFWRNWFRVSVNWFLWQRFASELDPVRLEERWSLPIILYDDSDFGILDFSGKVGGSHWGKIEGEQHEPWYRSSHCGLGRRFCCIGAFLGMGKMRTWIRVWPPVRARS